jgi:hypothetical protein
MAHCLFVGLAVREKKDASLPTAKQWHTRLKEDRECIHRKRRRTQK